MAKDRTQGMQRIDLRIPDHIYSEIERIAIANKLPFSPTTKPNSDGTLKTDKEGNVIQPKVSVSPIILDLINLGLKAIANGEENSDKLGDKTRHIEYQVNNQIDVSDIEKKIINTLSQQIEGILSEKILATFKTSPEIKDIFETLVTNKVKDLEQIVTAEKEINEGEISDNNPELIPDTDNFTSEIKEIVSLEDNPLELLPNSEVKSFDEAVKEVNRLKREGLGNTTIANKLTGKYLNKSGTGTKWSDTQVKRILTK